MRGERRVAAALIAALTLGLTACTPAMPATVVPGTEVVVGWRGEFTSANAASSPTGGNIDIAEMNRADFGDVIDGEFVPDTGFGEVSIVSDDPFTVRYDLAEPSWSDGIPLDAADLLLGWAGSSGYFREKAGEEPAEVERVVPSVDEFARSIEVTHEHPIIGWQQAVAVPVPAHVVGRRALGIEDAMEAKQAIITAIRDDDAAALAKIADVWNEGFEIGDDGEIPADLLLSSGPFQVDGVKRSKDGQSVTLVPNTGYQGAATPLVARIELVPPGDDPIGAIGERLDVAQVAPLVANRAMIKNLERRDVLVDTRHDGTLWALFVEPAGIFARHEARTAFFHAAPATSLIASGADVWGGAYAATTSMITAPGWRAYDIVSEDSGFAAALGSADEEPAIEREAAGVKAGAQVCVLYDRSSEFAAGAFRGLKAAASEAGWDVVDCGSDDFDTALGQGAWDAVIARVPIPQTPSQISAQWGTGGAASITGDADPARDELIARLAQTVDVYDARDLLAQIEATIVRAAVALPIAVNPRLTIIDSDVTSITPRTGSRAPLTYGAVQWEAVP